MAKYIIKRFIMMIATILIIATVTFILMHSVPGSPFDGERTSNPTIQANLEKFYKLDEPMHVQYLYYLKSIVTFDFGPSIKKPNDSVNELLARGFPISFELGMVTILVALISGIILGTLAALRHNGIIDYLAMTFAVVGISVPNFVLATLHIQQFAVNLEWFTAATWSSPTSAGRSGSCRPRGRSTSPPNGGSSSRGRRRSSPAMTYRSCAGCGFSSSG